MYLPGYSLIGSAPHPGQQPAHLVHVHQPLRHHQEQDASELKKRSGGPMGTHECGAPRSAGEY